ncbi:hypothetical protein R5R73_17030 [Salinicola sp. LHM]|uniref:hypothetical protein n=1 Tax=unclassified Salinicola TaxID=2634022 RepID=UPI0008DD9DAB|nr:MULTISPECIES: hypothetical protein [unclassified Salinicola]OHZ02779.1 hypothetical protein BC443_13745 [Salinicola sp. MIT1003]WQH32701.1 hypothetical protein R5R73_17030 [Salinicola sp. LHM]
MTRPTQRHATRLPTVLIAIGATLPLAAEAYVGPGAGLSLLTALWGIIAAIGMALFFVIMWPIRRMRRRRKAEAAASAERGAAESGSSTAQARTAQDPESPPTTTRVEESQRGAPHAGHRS